MTARLVPLLLLALCLALLATGCPKAPQEEAVTTETAPESMPAPPEGGEAAKTEPVAAGDAASLLADRCTQCHGIDKVEKEKGDAEEWGKIVKRMQGHAVKKQKTPITDEEAATILEHILATYVKP